MHVGRREDAGRMTCHLAGAVRLLVAVALRHTRVQAKLWSGRDNRCVTIAEYFSNTAQDLWFLRTLPLLEWAVRQ